MNVHKDDYKYAEEVAKKRQTGIINNTDDLLDGAGAITITNEGGAGARIEIRFSELGAAWRLHNTLIQMRVDRCRLTSPVRRFLVDRRDDLEVIKLGCEMSDAEASLWLIARETLEAVQGLQERVAKLENPTGD
jgi:hypothetical protein